MPLSWLVLIILAFAAAGYFIGWIRVLKLAGGEIRALHSLPIYYGTNVALSTAVPALSVLLVWLLAQPTLIERAVTGMITPEMIPDGSNLNLVMSDVRRVADGLNTAIASGAMSVAEVDAMDATVVDVRTKLGALGVALGQDVRPEVLAAAKSYRSAAVTGNALRTFVVLALALVGYGVSMRKTKPDFRARNVVEQAVLAFLMGAASLAILTTVGIVLSMLFETINFFGLHSWTDFFFAFILTFTEVQLLPVAIVALNSSITPWWSLSAAALVCVAPLIVVAFIVERYLSKGNLSGALK